VPEALPDSGSESTRTSRILRYRGIKEDVYAPDFQPDPGLLDELGLAMNDLVVTVRPPADEAHYHNPESEQLLVALMDRICRTPGIRAVMLPRNQRQAQSLRAAYPQWFAQDRTVVPARAVDGLNLLWYSDLVVSGGGTMNREAAALGVPVFSIFRGRTGAVDLRLEQEGRLTMIRTPEEIESRIPFTRRYKSIAPDNAPRAALQDIVDHIEDIIRREC
jgi:predicted glycosyltransferase